MNNLQQKIQTYLLDENSFITYGCQFLLLIIIALGKYILLEYDTIGIQFEVEDFNLPDTFENNIINNADAYSSNSSTGPNSNPYRSLSKTVQGQQYINKIRENWIKEFDPGRNRYVTNTIYFNSYMNQPKGFEERLGVDNGEQGKHVLRLIFEPLGVKYHIHGGYIPPEGGKEICVFYEEKEFNPLPFSLSTPYSTPNYPYQGAHMLEGIQTPFNPNWPPEVKNLYWKAQECNYRAMSERILAGHYPLHDDNVIMHKNMSKQAMDLCWKYRFNRDLAMSELNNRINEK